MMIKITRRDLLKASVASSVLATGNSCGHPNKLVVVFHGSFAFSFDPKKPEGEQLTIVAPLVTGAAHPGTGHVYKAGNFSETVDLSAGVYRLLGATAGNVSSPDRKQCTAVQRVNTRDPMETNVILKMPLPDKFRGLRYMQPKDASNMPVDLFQDGLTKTQNDV